MFTTKFLMDFFLTLQREKWAMICFYWVESTSHWENPITLLHEECWPTSNKTAAPWRQERTGQMAADGREWTSSPPDSGACQEAARFRRTSSGTGAHWPLHRREVNHQGSVLPRSRYEYADDNKGPWAPSFREKCDKRCPSLPSQRYSD